MKNHKKILALLVGYTLLTTMALSGCTNGQSQNTPESVAESSEEVPAPSESESQEVSSEAEVPDESVAQTQALTLTVMNLSNVSIGMFSVIDPATGEQINLDGMEPGESISMECNWPVDTQNFQWALYNLNGELCTDASTDITSAKESAVLVLTGDNNIDDVKVLFDTELPDSE